MDHSRQLNAFPAHEIAAVGADSLWLFRLQDYPASGRGELWRFGQFYSAQARQVMEAVRDTVRRTTVVDEWCLELLVRTRSSDDESMVKSEVVLFYRGPIEDGDEDVVNRMRRRAAQHLAALQAPHTIKPARLGADTRPFLTEGESPTALDDPSRFSGAGLLGQKIEYGLTATVPGRPALRLEGTFRRAPHRPTETEVIHVVGRITSTKSGGRFQSVGVDGKTGEHLSLPFRAPRVEVHGSARDHIRDAVASPSLRLRMVIRKSITSTSKSKPLTTYTLVSAQKAPIESEAL